MPFEIRSLSEVKIKLRWLVTTLMGALVSNYTNHKWRGSQKRLERIEGNDENLPVPKLSKKRHISLIVGSQGVTRCTLSNSLCEVFKRWPRHSPYSTTLPLDVRPDDSFYISKASCEFGQCGIEWEGHEPSMSWSFLRPEEAKVIKNCEDVWGR